MIERKIIASLWNRMNELYINENFEVLFRYLNQVIDVTNNIEELNDSTLQTLENIESIFSMDKNLFDKSKMTAGNYVVYSTGLLAANSGYQASDYILIEPNGWYSVNPINQHAWYDSAKKYISGGNALSTSPIQAPPNAMYLRMSVKNADVDTLMINKGQVQLPYKPYGETNAVETTVAELLGFKADFYGSYDNFKILDKLFIQSPNLINPNNLVQGKFVKYSDGTLADSSSYYASDYIPVTEGLKYWFDVLNQYAWYNESKAFVSGGSNATTTNPLTAPIGAKYIRVSIRASELDQAQLVQTSTQPEYQPFGVVLNQDLLNPDADKTINKGERLYNISQIFAEWKQGNKFPIAFFDDSQTDGSGTTGFTPNELGVDRHNPNAYPKLLEDRFKELTGNSNLRVYNAGFSGQTAAWALANFDNEFGTGKPFNDTKIAFVGFGTNDRLRRTSTTDYYNSFRSELSGIIDKFLSMGVQPVLMTEQPSIAPGVDTRFTTEHPLRTSGWINAITNKVKHDLAEEYNLEIVDLTEMIRKVMNGVSTSLSSIYNATDKLHFGDEGHKLVRDVFTSVIYPFTQKITDSDIIDFSSQYIYKGAPEDLVKNSGKSGYIKTYVNHAVTKDELLLKQSIYIDDYVKYALRCFKLNTTAESSVYVKVDGVTLSTPNSTIDALVDVTLLEPGYHDIEIWSGTSHAGLYGLSLSRQKFEM